MAGHGCLPYVIETTILLTSLSWILLILCTIIIFYFLRQRKKIACVDHLHDIENAVPSPKKQTPCLRKKDLERADKILPKTKKMTNTFKHEGQQLLDSHSPPKCPYVGEHDIQVTVVKEQLLGAPKRKSTSKSQKEDEKPDKSSTQEPETATSAETSKDKDEKSTGSSMQAEEKNCKYCKYRHMKGEKIPTERFYTVSKFSEGFRDYLVHYSTVTEFPQRQGLLEPGDEICNGCRCVLRRKYDAFERNAVPYTPQKRGRKSLSVTESQPSLGSEQEMVPFDEQTTAKKRKKHTTTEVQIEKSEPEIDAILISHSPSTSKDLQNITPKKTKVAEVCEETVETAADVSTCGNIFNQKCAVCKNECHPQSVHKKYRNFRPCGASLAAILTSNGYAFCRETENMIHESCRRFGVWKDIHSEREVKAKTDAKKAKDEAIKIAIGYVRQEVLEERNPLLFQDILQKYSSSYYLLYDPDVEETSKDVSLLQYYVSKLVEEEEKLKSHKIEGKQSVMYFHEDMDFLQWSHDQLDQRETTSPQSSTAEDYKKIFTRGPSDAAAIHNCLELLRNEMKNATKICQIYGQYPDLISSLTQKELLFEGKYVRVQTPGEGELPPQDHEVLIPPYPPVIQNVVMQLCAPQGSDLERRGKMGEIDYSKHYYDPRLDVSFYSSVTNIISTMLHQHNKHNVYPWPILMSQIMHHPSQAKRLKICKQLGMIPSESTYARYKTWVAARNQERMLHGEPFGYVEGHHISFHLDNKEFRSKYSVKQPLKQYLAACGIQPKPSHQNLKLPPDAYSSPPSSTPQIHDFDMVEYMASFPNQFEINAAYSEKEIAPPEIIQSGVSEDQPISMEDTQSQMVSSGITSLQPKQGKLLTLHSAEQHGLEQDSAITQEAQVSIESEELYDSSSLELTREKAASLSQSITIPPEKEGHVQETVISAGLEELDRGEYFGLSTLSPTQHDQDEDENTPQETALPKEPPKDHGGKRSFNEGDEATTSTSCSTEDSSVATIKQQYKRPIMKVKLLHSNIPEYEVPTVPAAPLRHEYVHQRSDFLVESIADKLSYEKYQSIAYTHAGLRNLGSHEETTATGQWSQLLPNLKEFVKLEYQEVEASVFVWLAVVPGIPNSPKVLVHVLELINDIFIRKKKMRHVIITADAVEYQALYRIRSDYGAMFGHIYLFFGMWHALANYLKQFFKAYRHAGIETMLNKLYTPAQVELIMKVTPNWSLANKSAMCLTEALVRNQWQEFLNHASNGLGQDEHNVFNQEEQETCMAALNKWQEKSEGYINLAASKCKVTANSKNEETLTAMSKEGSPTTLRSGKVLQAPMETAKTLHFSSASESESERESLTFPSSPIVKEQSDTTSPCPSISASSPYGVLLPESPMEVDEKEGSLSTEGATSAIMDTKDDHQIESAYNLNDLEEEQEKEPVDLENKNHKMVKQRELHESFRQEVLPFLSVFIERAEKQDKMFFLFSKMIKDLMPYVIGHISTRFDDFEAQLMVIKLMYEKVHVTQQSMYKHILLQVLEEFPRWDTFPKQCFQIAPGANEIDGSVGASLARDEAHERVISLNLAYHHPLHATEENVEIMCQSAPVLCHNIVHMEKHFFKQEEKSHSCTPTERSKEEKVVQSHVQILKDFEAFKVKDREKLFQPGTENEVPEALAESFLQKDVTSRSIAEAIVEQTVLNKRNYSRSALKKVLVKPFPNFETKQGNKKAKKDVEKKILTSLLHSAIKQQEGQSTETLVGIGIAEKPPLFFNDDGTPLTNTNKSLFRGTVLKRYGENDFYYTEQKQVENKAVFIDGMPALFTSPILGLTTFGTYVQFLINRKVQPHFTDANEVHIVFDVSNIWGFNLKKGVQQKRDIAKKPIAPLQTEIQFETKVPSSTQWSGFLAERGNKQKLIYFIGKRLLEAGRWLKSGQKLIVGGCFSNNKTYIIDCEKVTEVENLVCNHEEADTRLFAHATWSEKDILEFVATDTDIFAILLLNHHHFEKKQTVINSSDERGKLDMSRLIKKMHEDPNIELARLRKDGVASPLVFGLIHPLIGSDILCTTRGFKAASVMKTCLDFATYLFNKDHGLQLLAHSNDPPKGPYLRYVLALFKKKFANTIKKKPEEILRPNTDYSDIISEVQKETWAHTLDKKMLLPSQDCLYLREKNLSFQLQLWGQATKPQMMIPKPENFGWEKTENGFELQPDSEANLKKQKGIYDTIMRKCACKSIRCLTRLCKCKKAGNKCTSLCGCINCENSDDREGGQEVHSDPEPVDTLEEDTSESETEDLDMVDAEMDDTDF